MPGMEDSSAMRDFCFNLTQAMYLGKVSEYEKTVKRAQELGIIGADFMEHLPESHKYLTQFVNDSDMVKFLLQHVDCDTKEGAEFGAKIIGNAVKNGANYKSAIEAAQGNKTLLSSIAQSVKKLDGLAKCIEAGADIKAFDFEQTFIKCLKEHTMDSDLKFVTLKALKAGYQLDIDKLAKGKEIKERKLAFVKNIVQTYHNADKSLIEALQEDNADKIREQIGDGRLSEDDIKYMTELVENSQRGKFFNYYMTVMKSVPEAEKETLSFKQAEELYKAEEKRKEEERIAENKHKDEEQLKALQSGDIETIRETLSNGVLRPAVIEQMEKSVGSEQENNFYLYYKKIMESSKQARKYSDFAWAEKFYVRNLTDIAALNEAVEMHAEGNPQERVAQLIKENIKNGGNLHQLMTDIKSYPQETIDYLLKDNELMSKELSESILNDADPQQLAADIRELPQETINYLAKDVADHFFSYRYYSETTDRTEKEKSTPKIEDFHKIKLLAACLVLYEAATGANKNALKAELLRYRTSGENEDRREKAHMFIKARNILEGDLKEDTVVKGLSHVSYTKLSSLNKALRENSDVDEIKDILKSEKYRLDSLKEIGGISAVGAAGVAAILGIGHHALTSAPDYPEGYYPEDYYDPMEMMMTSSENTDFEVFSKEEFEQKVKEQGQESKDGKTCHFHHHKGGRSY